MERTIHNLRGLRCPMPIVRILKIVAELAPGVECTCVADDPGFPADIEAWCRKTGHALVESERTEEGQRVTIRKAGAESN